tara:strand:- start:10402 stop:11352 length:951 start_codon:yes stop_codon:yes gene_type:complete
MKKYLLGLLFPMFLISCSSNHVNKAKDPLLVEAKNNFYDGDYKNAAKDLHVLSKSGDPEAQYALGYMYYYGMGVEKNPIVARRLISMSAEKGNVEAVKALRLLVESNAVFANVQSVEPKQLHGSNAKNTTVAINHINEKTELVKPAETNNSLKSSSSNDDFKELAKKDMENSFKLVKFDNSKAKIKSDSKPMSDKIATQSNQKSTESNAINNLNQWLIKESADAYTIQLAANKNKQVIQDFIDKNKLSNKAKIYTYHYNNEQWYAVSLGVYNEPAVAFNVLTKLPSSIKANKPWVRQLSNIKKEALALDSASNRIG